MLSLTSILLFFFALSPNFSSSTGMADAVHPAALAMASGGDDMMSILSPGMTGAAVLLAVHHVWFNHVKPVLDGHTKSA